MQRLTNCGHHKPRIISIHPCGTGSLSLSLLRSWPQISGLALLWWPMTQWRVTATAAKHVLVLFLFNGNSRNYADRHHSDSSGKSPLKKKEWNGPLACQLLIIVHSISVCRRRTIEICVLLEKSEVMSRQNVKRLKSTWTPLVPKIDRVFFYFYFS